MIHLLGAMIRLIARTSIIIIISLFLALALTTTHEGLPQISIWLFLHHRSNAFNSIDLHISMEVTSEESYSESYSRFSFIAGTKILMPVHRFEIPRTNNNRPQNKKWVSYAVLPLLLLLLLFNVNQMNNDPSWFINDEWTSIDTFKSIARVSTI